MSPLLTPRRVFLRAGEVPGLLAGALRGDAAALRRILGARKAGRLGAAAALLGLIAAVPRPEAALLVGVQLVLGLPGRGIAKPPLSWREYQRLSLWLVGPALLASAPLRLLPIETWPTALIVVVCANVWLWRNLRRGLG